MHIGGLNKQELEEECNTLNLLIDIAHTFLNEPDKDLALERCLASICVGLNFSVGHLYVMADQMESHIIARNCWFFENAGIPSTRKRTIISQIKQCGEGIARIVCTSGASCFINNINEASSFLRIPSSRQSSLLCAAAFPIYKEDHAKKHIYAVIELFSQNIKQEYPYTLLQLEQISHHLSLYMTHQNRIDAYSQEINKLKYATGSSNIGIWEYDPKTQVVTWDEQMHSMYGIIPQDFGGTYQSWENTLHPEDCKKAALAFKKALERDKPFNTTFRIITPSKIIRYIHATAVVKRAEDSSAIHVFGVNIDITKQRKTELALAKKTEALKKINQNLKKQAYFDALTGLMNRRSFFCNATLYLARSHRLGSTLLVLYIDLDDFKKINDTLGHAIGDLVLIETAKRLKAISRKEDIISRMGGDEFIAILELKTKDSITKVTNKIIDIIKKTPYLIRTHTLNITVSVGAASYPQDGTTCEDLIQRADMALLNAKKMGKNNACLYSNLSKKKPI